MRFELPFSWRPPLLAPPLGHETLIRSSTRPTIQPSGVRAPIVKQNQDSTPNPLRRIANKKG